MEKQEPAYHIQGSVGLYTLLLTETDLVSICLGGIFLRFCLQSVLLECYQLLFTQTKHRTNLQQSKIQSHKGLVNFSNFSIMMSTHLSPHISNNSNNGMASGIWNMIFLLRHLVCWTNCVALHFILILDFIVVSIAGVWILLIQTSYYNHCWEEL